MISEWPGAGNWVMLRSMANKPVWLGLHWLMLGVTAVLLVLVATFVDLKPVLDENFFFSASDPGYRQSKISQERYIVKREALVAS